LSPNVYNPSKSTPQPPSIAFTIHLEHNEIETLPAGLFNGIYGLNWLRLEHNQMVTLPSKIFDRLHALPHLYLGHNRLGPYLPPRLFDRLSGVLDLDLSANGLRNVSKEDFQGERGGA
jgi:Leucine-rich repeat (LRR) protein